METEQSESIKTVVKHTTPYIPWFRTERSEVYLRKTICTIIRKKKFNSLVKPLHEL